MCGGEKKNIWMENEREKKNKIVKCYHNIFINFSQIILSSELLLAITVEKKIISMVCSN